MLLSPRSTHNQTIDQRWEVDWQKVPFLFLTSTSQPDFYHKLLSTFYLQIIFLFQGSGQLSWTSNFFWNYDHLFSLLILQFSLSRPNQSSNFRIPNNFLHFIPSLHIDMYLCSQLFIVISVAYFFLLHPWSSCHFSEITYTIPGETLNQFSTAFVLIHAKYFTIWITTPKFIKNPSKIVYMCILRIILKGSTSIYP